MAYLVIAQHPEKGYGFEGLIRFTYPTLEGAEARKMEMEEQGCRASITELPEPEDDWSLKHQGL